MAVSSFRSAAGKMNVNLFVERHDLPHLPHLPHLPVHAAQSPKNAYFSSKKDALCIHFIEYEQLSMSTYELSVLWCIVKNSI